MGIRQGKAKILGNQRIGPDYFKISLAAPQLAKKARPGNFVMVKVTDGLEPLLRRPLGVHRASGSRVELLYEVVGRGTKVLSERKPGENIDIIGPLGNGFEACLKQERPVLIAGGMGVAPLLFLAEKLKVFKPLVLIGGRTREHILCQRDFKRCGCTVLVSTDDGSAGFKGRVTDLLKQVIKSGGRQALYACGPSPMLKEISVFSRQSGLSAQISLESHMACGIGACLGCAVNTVSGYRRVCKEGPVFDASTVVW